MNIRVYYKYIEYILIIIAVVVAIISSKYKIKHPFWDKQPVMRQKSNRLGLISNNMRFNIMFKPNQKLHINNISFKRVHTFLDKQFSNNYNINETYLKYIFYKPNSYNIALTEDNKIIGFIHSDPIEVCYNKNKIKMNYVDYLCIDTTYRNNYLATILIAAIINMSHNNTPFIFKKEQYKLPYQHIIKSDYYIKDLLTLKPSLSSKIEFITPYNFYKYYAYTNTLLSRYTFRKQYTKQEFYELFLKKKILHMYIINNISNHKTIIIGKKNIYKSASQIYNCFEIDIVIGETRYIKNVYDILSNHLKNEGYNFICIAALANNIQFIKSNDFIKSYPLYYYTYNYNIPSIDHSDFCFNIN